MGKQLRNYTTERFQGNSKSNQPYRGYIRNTFSTKNEQQWKTPLEWLVIHHYHFRNIQDILVLCKG